MRMLSKHSYVFSLTRSTLTFSPWKNKFLTYFEGVYHTAMRMHVSFVWFILWLWILKGLGFLIVCHQCGITFISRAKPNQIKEIPSPVQEGKHPHSSKMLKIQRTHKFFQTAFNVNLNLSHTSFIQVKNVFLTNQSYGIICFMYTIFHKRLPSIFLNMS